MIELESHYLATTIVIIVLGKNYRITSCNGSMFGEKQDVYIVSKNLSTHLFTKDKMVTLN